MSQQTRYTMTIRSGHPDFLDLPWALPLATWDTERLVELPKGISRHVVRYVRYDDTVYVVKELPTRAARREYDILRALEREELLTVPPVGLIENRNRDDEHAEDAAALITCYVPFSFSYRELLEGAGFGADREPLLDAFAGLLAELHIAGCFWGDCSLSNVLLRRDADGLATVMVDAETAELHRCLSDGRRHEDLALMVENVAGGMADMAAAQGLSIDDADLWLGEDIAERYHYLWNELFGVESIRPEERHKIDERVRRIHDLGFDIEALDLERGHSDERLMVKIRPGGRRFHANRLASLTGLEVSERQARRILDDLYYYRARRRTEMFESPGSENAAALEWRTFAFEPMLARLREFPDIDPVQGYCDVLVHRYLRSEEAGYDIGTEAAFEDWLQRRERQAS